MTRDPPRQAMGAATAAWVRDNPGGLAISLVGNGHASFGCGAPARCEMSRDEPR